MTRLASVAAAIVIAAGLPTLASMPGEDEGPAPRPEAGTGAGAALATGMSARGAEAALPVTYEVFEATVPHVDLAECPAVMAQEGHFCRLGLASEQLTVFVFAEDGDQPLTGVRSWPADVVLSQLK